MCAARFRAKEIFMEQINAFNPKQAAKYVGVTEATLRSWRSRGEGPRYFRAGKLIRYRRSDLDAWIEARLSEPDDSATRVQHLESQIST
jgi:excisionase family DNA binding protein